MHAGPVAVIEGGEMINHAGALHSKSAPLTRPNIPNARLRELRELRALRQLRGRLRTRILWRPRVRDKCIAGLEAFRRGLHADGLHADGIPGLRLQGHARPCKARMQLGPVPAHRFSKLLTRSGFRVREVTTACTVEALM